MSFIRNVENFTCERCGTEVVGSGYTNHCPKCLWSKHVDVQPGDRAAACGGMMEPAGLEGSSPEYAIVHVCESCGFSRRNRVQDSDDRNAVLKIAERTARR